jgi:hypothetical protein
VVGSESDLCGQVLTGIGDGGDPLVGIAGQKAVLVIAVVGTCIAVIEAIGLMGGRSSIAYPDQAVAVIGVGQLVDFGSGSRFLPVPLQGRDVTVGAVADRVFGMS